MIGQTISRYKILSKLGAGGMGEVYLAEDTELGREVALKVLPAGFAEDPDRLERFRREARAIAALNHPNIVTIFNVEEAAGRRFLVMERVAGRSLDRLIPSQGLPLPRVFDIAVPIAEALAAAHEKGITHRDLKPSNVMVDDNGPAGSQVKVLDFGLAKLAADIGAAVPGGGIATQAKTETATLTGEGVVMGTAPYMSPEQLQGKPVDARTDIFSFGILLYEMVVGQRPFQGETGLELASSILKDAPSSVVEVRGDVPRQLGRIIQHCLEKDPERRFQSAKDIRNELDELRQELDSGTLEVSGSGQVSTVGTAVSGKKRPLAATLLAVTVFVALIALAAFWWSRRTHESPDEAIPVAPGQPAVAVLPFRNMGADESVDYLRLAVPDEITTTLSRAPGLAIRPFSMTSGIQTAALDPLAMGRDLGVGRIVTGQYLQEGDRLSLTLEAIDVERNVVVWRESVVVSAQELLSLRAAVAETVQRDLLPILGSETPSGGTLPTNEEAYDLYLRSLSATSDRGPNAEAVQLLERAVELDPNYAPAWSELAARYYFIGNYGGGGEEYYNRSVEAARRALELDSELVDPAVRLIVVSVERGRLNEAYDAANRLLMQRPDAARAHFARSYVLRYGGAVDGAIRDCDAALALDPRNPMLRSCGIANALAGRYERALQFLELDRDSGLSIDNMVVVRLRQNRPHEALELMRRRPSPVWRFTIPFLEGEPFPTDGVRAVVEGTLALRDSEQPYWSAVILAYCGEHTAALTLLRDGIGRGYCSYPFMDSDPLLAGLRADTALADEYAEAREAGKACHEAFLAHTRG